MSLVLDEFYSNLSHVGVSALTGSGMTQLFQKIDEKRKEYYEFYKPELDKKKEQNKQLLAALKKEQEAKASNETELGEKKTKTREVTVEDPDIKAESQNKAESTSKTVRFVDDEDAEEREEYRKLMAWLKED